MELWLAVALAFMVISTLQLFGWLYTVKQYDKEIDKYKLEVYLNSKR